METMPLHELTLLDKSKAIGYKSNTVNIKNLENASAPNGVNTKETTYTLVWKQLSKANKNTVEAFLQSKGSCVAWLAYLDDCITPVKVRATAPYSITFEDNSFTLSIPVRKIYA